MLVALVISSLKDRKEEICTELNNMINVPMVSEKKEQACIESIFDAVVQVLEKVLSKV
jgi:hypothetical protein